MQEFPFSDGSGTKMTEIGYGLSEDDGVRERGRAAAPTIFHASIGMTLMPSAKIRCSPCSVHCCCCCSSTTDGIILGDIRHISYLCWMAAAAPKRRKMSFVLLQMPSLSFEKEAAEFKAKKDMQEYRREQRSSRARWCRRHWLFIHITF